MKVQYDAWFSAVATCDIEEGQELYISYVSATDAVEKRQQDLRRQFWFTCRCPKCEADEQKL